MDKPNVLSQKPDYRWSPQLIRLVDITHAVLQMNRFRVFRNRRRVAEDICMYIAIYGDFCMNPNCSNKSKSEE